MRWKTFLCGKRRNGRAVGLWLMVLLTFRAFCSKAQSLPPATAPTCPLDFTLLNQYPSVANTIQGSPNNKTLQCQSVDHGLEAVIALYLRKSSYFLVPKGTSAACIKAYQSQLESQGVSSEFNISQSCKLNLLLSERGTDLCHNIQSAQDFQNMVPVSQLDTLNSSCSGSLDVTTTACGTCNTATVPIVITLNEVSASDNSSCSTFVTMYTIAVANQGGAQDPDTALCLLYIESDHGGGNKNLKFIAVGVGGMLFICIVGALLFFYKHWRRMKADREARKKRTKDLLSATSVPSSSINWFDIDELKKATGNFSRNNILGTGGFGNVYKGTLPDGSVVAVKRFKNCAPAGDKDFVHEVEMISSVKHRHLVEIKGCCVDSSTLHGHQRMIVYDLMSNGSVQDHLFWKEEKGEGAILLTWPMRRKIAIGTARGLSYLHHDAVPAIFHRDIKSSNILLDDDWNARLADFGLAKFTPEGVTHVTTRVAGTHGYVAPEYALYGQLTEKSDVYSFGMVILELVTGKKALSMNADDPPHTLLSDWAWPLVKEGKWRQIVDPRMGNDIGSKEEMERFILVGLLCAHPQVFYRPSVDQALKMLESGSFGVPSVPDRPLPFTSNQAEIDHALSQETLERRDRSRRTGYSSYSVGSVSIHSSDYSGSLPSSWYERKVSSDRSQQEMSNQWSEASASQPPSMYERRASPERPQDMVSIHSSDYSGSPPSSWYERKVSSDRSQQELSNQWSEASASQPFYERRVSPGRAQDTLASQPPSLDEKKVSADRTQELGHKEKVSPGRERDDLEKGSLGVPSDPDQTLPFTSTQAEIHQPLSQESLTKSMHSSDYSGSLPSSWYERKVSSDRSQQDTSYQWSEASASQPSSLYERGQPPIRTQDTMGIQSKDPLASRPLDGDEKKTSPGRGGDDLLQKKVSPDRTRADDDLEKGHSPNRS